MKIDQNGIHVGGPSPVDIALPQIPGLGAAIVIIAILSPFLCIFSICALLFYFRSRRNRMLHETIRAMVEKGVPIPPELLMGNALGGGRLRRLRSDLRTGLVLLFLGVAIYVSHGRFGLIPALMGAAFLLVWLVERKEERQSPPQAIK